MKVVINRAYGAFNLSNEALCWMRDHGRAVSRNCAEISRNDPMLVKCVEVLGSTQASGWGSRLKLVEIPDGVNWEIEGYDGMEWVSEVHKRWY